MSAFIVSDKHINTLVSFASAQQTVAYSPSRKVWMTVTGNEQAIAELLLAENTRSVNYRYKENAPARQIRFGFEAVLESVAIFRACACLEYQSCETSDFEGTDANAVIKAIVSSAIKSLPGYYDAPSSIR